MTRQKLPDGWEYNAHGEACDSAEPLHVVWFADITKEVASDHEDPDLAKCTPSAVSLAVIRNAGADQVYEAARRLVKSFGGDEFFVAWTELTRLIDSSEEPT